MRQHCHKDVSCLYRDYIRNCVVLNVFSHKPLKYVHIQMSDHDKNDFSIYYSPISLQSRPRKHQSNKNEFRLQSQSNLSWFIVYRVEVEFARQNIPQQPQSNRQTYVRIPRNCMHTTVHETVGGRRLAKLKVRISSNLSTDKK